MTAPVETSGLLKKSGQATLDASGNAVLTFDPDNANQRWEINSVVVATDQMAAATTVPIATLAINTLTLSTMSAGNQRGATWSGNNDTFVGRIDLGGADFLAVLWSPPPGQPHTTLVGVIASAVITGTKYTRRG
jgi:hypothetical protein